MPVNDDQQNPAPGLAEHESLGFLLADNLRLTRRIAAQYFAQHNLTLAQTRALLGVLRWPGIRQVALADAMDIQPISLARLLDQLAASGLVERRPDPTDRRAFQLYLTPAAGPIVEVIHRASAAFQQQALAGFSAIEQQALIQGLNRLRHNLTQLHKSAVIGPLNPEVNE